MILGEGVRWGVNDGDILTLIEGVTDGVTVDVTLIEGVTEGLTVIEGVTEGLTL